MAESSPLRTAILDRLSGVIDPETGVDVVRMRLIEDLAVDEAGIASLKFRPSSALCPLAVPLAQAIQASVEQVQGVTGVELQVVGYIQADELTALIREAFDRPQGEGRS
jgi:metal-sulfur cluster biosynthetic enzyme